MRAHRTPLGHFKTGLVLLATCVAFVPGACSRSPAPPLVGTNCIALSDSLLAQLGKHPAVSRLPHAAQAQLMDSLGGSGKICLTAPTIAVNCNTGGARAPEFHRCCKFAQPPRAIVSGLPQHIAIREGSDPASPPSVDLTLSATIEDLQLDQRCEVPTCEADRAMARPYVDVAGRLSNDDAVIDMELRLDLGKSVDLLCGLPESEDEAS